MPNPENVKPYEMQPGTTLNPKGRPKGSRNRSTIIREVLELVEDIKNPVTGKEIKANQELVMTLAILNKARKGDIQAYKALMDSAYGAPLQQIHHEGENEFKPVINVIQGSAPPQRTNEEDV